MIHDTQKGFTLVELAIALMVIGLLIGGVLKGQELIENARMTATMRQIKSYDAAALIFRNTYNALPGDIKRPNRIPNCTEDMCNIGGNGNGRVSHADTTPNSIEVYNFFPHLTKAGMIQGPEGSTQEEMTSVASEHPESFMPELPIDSVYTIRAEYEDGTYAPTRKAGNYYWMALSGAYGSKLDSKMDDGKPASGDVQLRDLSECESPDDPEMYDLARDKCAMYVTAGF